MMDKLLFFFHRKDGLTHAEFADHYLQVHAPLGQRLTVTMAGYTVNIVEASGGGELDAVTEVWTASMADFFDPSKSFATPEDAAQLMADHDSFIGPYDAYAVEEQVVVGSLPDGPLGGRTPGAKVVSWYRDDGDVPEPPVGATRVIDHRVVQVVTSGSPPLAVIRSAWAPDAAALGSLVSDAHLVGEYRRTEPAE